MLSSASHSWATVVLAAGASTRFGGQPKALAEVAGEAAVWRIVRVAREAGARPVVVVVGVHADLIERALRSSGATVVRNALWARGRTGSVQVGVRSVGTETDIVLWPVDHPFAVRRTLEALRETARRDLIAAWFIPTFQGRGGHPVLWRAGVSPLVLELDPATPLRTLLPKLGPQVRRLEVDDAGVTENVDSPSAYQQASDRFQGRRDSWTVD